MSENGINFKFFSPLTTPTVARCKLAQQKKKEADLICNFSSDSDNSSIFITQSKAKGSVVIKQPRRQVIESIITSLDSVDSDSGSKNLFAPNLKATKHRKKKTNNIKRPPDLINSELSYVYSDCEKSSPVKKLIVSADKTNTCSSHRKSYCIQSENRTRLFELPVSNFNLNLKSSSGSPDHGKSSSSESNDNSAPGKSKLNISSGRRKMSSRSSSESDLISDESVDSIIGSGVGAGLTSSERKHSGTSHVTSYMHQNSSSESESDEQKGSKNSIENIHLKSPQKGSKNSIENIHLKSPQKGSKNSIENIHLKSPQKGSKNSIENIHLKSPQKMKINSQPQKKQRHKRMPSSSSDSESESDLDLDDKKSASTKVKISSIVQASKTASTDVSKESPLKGKHLSGSKCAVDTVSDYISESESGSDGHTSPVIQKQNIRKHVTESQDQSTVIAPFSPSSEIEAGRSKSTNQSRKVKRFQCTEEFEEVGNIGDTLLPIKKSAKKEFWLIKTPWDFDISKLDRATIPLVGSIRLPVTEGAKHFEVMAIPKSKEEVLKMGILLADDNLDSLVYGPSLAGQIHVIESSASLPLVEIQAQPKTRHQIPQDLKQRHVPFGAECPLQTMKTNGMAGEKKGEKRKHEEVEKRKKKKKKKKIEG